jgi:acetaldehyde dehydrogenase / alcohol dehydrogenase
MLDRSRWAAAKSAEAGSRDARRIVDAVADAGHAKAQHYAEWAVRETGMGVVEHKRIKNEACSRGLVEMYSRRGFHQPRIDAAKKIVELPRPAGVIFALIPVTNPVATVFFKTIMALMTRNAIVLSPHPQAKVCAPMRRACSWPRREGRRGAGRRHPGDRRAQYPADRKLMADERVDLDRGHRRALGREGGLPFGQSRARRGPGNAPVVVDDTADLKLAAQNDRGVEELRQFHPLHQ